MQTKILGTSSISLRTKKNNLKHPLLDELAVQMAIFKYVCDCLHFLEKFLSTPCNALKPF